VIGAAAVLLQDLGPGEFVLGYPAVDHREWKRQQAALRRLPELLHRLARLEKAAPAARSGRVARARRSGVTRRSRAGRA
jgi:hypothetical protein